MSGATVSLPTAVFEFAIKRLDADGDEHGVAALLRRSGSTGACPSFDTWYRKRWPNALLDDEGTRTTYHYMRLAWNAAMLSEREKGAERD